MRVARCPSATVRTPSSSPLIGDYSILNFSKGSDGNSGTLITDPAVDSGTLAQHH